MEPSDETPEEAQASEVSGHKPYHWFQGESVVALYQYLVEYGADVARVEVHTHGDQMFFRVKGPDGDGGDINNSHVCPPFCG